MYIYWECERGDLFLCATHTRCGHFCKLSFQIVGLLIVAFNSGAMLNSVMFLLSKVLLSSDNSADLWNICAWDPNNGVSLATFKGLSSAAHTLDVINDYYVISAAGTKPLIHVWPLHKVSQVQTLQTLV